MTRLIVIVGPTASGKSRLAIDAARAVDGEVVSADSQQVYIGMDIGTGKVSAAERGEVPHHLIDIVRPDEVMSAQRFIELADAAIADIAGRGRHVVVAGGTMLYVRALLYGLFDGPPADAALRESLSAEAAVAGTPALWERLSRVDPVAASRIDRNDLKRIVRALEVHALTGEPISAHQARHDHATIPPRYPVQMIGILPEREALYRAINARVEAMLEAGWVDEVARLRAAGYGPALRSQQAIGYEELHAHLDGRLELADAVQKIKKSSRRYARRQMSWYRRDRDVVWHPSGSDVDLSALQRYLSSPD